ncbi:hypothetical protein BDV19DRAFT_42310 [Aspergillus venezuelensis]
MLPSCASRSASRRFRTPLAFPLNCLRRRLHANHPPKPFDVAILGGGITGLTAAYRLSKDPYCTKVTLYEKSNRLGGWIDSEKIKVDGGDIVFEYGPRTLRVSEPASYALLDLIIDLGLENEMLLTSKDSPAAQNRYIYYPDHLVRVPSPQKGAPPLRQFVDLISTLYREPLFRPLLWSILAEPWKRPPKNVPHDESVMEFVSRCFGPKVADNLASSVFHGIYAGNIDELSAGVLLRGLRDAERNAARSLLGGALIGWLRQAAQGETLFGVDDLSVMDTLINTKSAPHRNRLRELANGTSTLTFKNGVGQLVETLTAALKRSDKVEILTNVDVTGISQDEQTQDLTVECGPQNKSRVHNHLIATIPPSEFLKISPQSTQDQEGLSRTLSDVPRSKWGGDRKHQDAVSVMVINLYYPDPNLVPTRGFGYLIPRSVPTEQNPERALGVIFASESSIGQDSAPGTKLTVMMGGHYWAGLKDSEYPDHDTAVAMARSLLKRHLGITDIPTIARTRLQSRAIPQPTVGHAQCTQYWAVRMRTHYYERISLAGAWYSVRGTGVVDAIRQAYIAAAFHAKAYDIPPRVLDAVERSFRKDLDPIGFNAKPYGMTPMVPNALDSSILSSPHFSISTLAIPTHFEPGAIPGAPCLDLRLTRDEVRCIQHHFSTFEPQRQSK